MMHHAVTMHQDSNASLPSNAFATNWRNCLGIGTVTCHVKQRLGLHVQWLLCLLFWCLKSRTNIRSTWVLKKSRKILVCEAGGQIITASPPSSKKMVQSETRLGWHVKSLEELLELLLELRFLVPPWRKAVSWSHLLQEKNTSWKEIICQNRRDWTKCAYDKYYL